MAEGRAIDLMPLETVPVGLSRRRELHVPNHGDVITHAYLVDVPTLRFIASSPNSPCTCRKRRSIFRLDLWEDGRKSLGRFLQRAGVQ